MIYDYNTQRKKLVLPEYGRNVEKLVQYCMTLENREERNNCAQAIVAIMGNLNPHYKENSDYKHKLWDHLAIISDFKLDVDYPYEIVTPEVLKERPNKVPYNKNQIKVKHYGKIIELMIEEAIKIDDEDKQKELVYLIANHMKRLYLQWNNEEMISDDHIYNNLEELSNGRLNVDRSRKLSECRDIVPPKIKPQQKHHHHNRKKR